MPSPLTQADREEVQRIISGGDPDFIDDDPADFDPPPPIPAEDAAAAEAILMRAGKG